MKLPDKFCFRVARIPGFTHTITKNSNGDYEVKWARGYPHRIRAVPAVVFVEEYVQRSIKSNEWVVVDDKPKQDELPDEFYFSTGSGIDYKAIKRPTNYQVVWPSDDEGTTYSFGVVEECVRTGSWKIINKRTHTVEEQRYLAELKERVAQLEHTIKLNEQDIEHKKRLIGNYESTKQDLLKKIEEMA